MEEETNNFELLQNDFEAKLHNLHKVIDTMSKNSLLRFAKAQAAGAVFELYQDLAWDVELEGMKLSLELEEIKSKLLMEHALEEAQNLDKLKEEESED